MVIFHAHLSISDTVPDGTSDSNTSTDEGELDVDAPSFNGVLVDLEGICKEILAAHIQHFIDDDIQLFPLHCRVEYSLMAVGKTFEQIVDKELFEQLKKQREPDKPPLNLESLQNDIQFGIDMIKSVTPNLASNIEMLGVVNWQYHILNKHFGIQIPNEIKDLTANFGKTEK